jgi:hypothetical protein
MHRDDILPHRGQIRTQELPRRQIRRNLAVIHQHHAIGQVECLIQIVGHQQHRYRHLRPQPAHHVLHFRARQRIQRAKRLVHQQDVLPGRQRTCQPYSLSLPTAELVGQPSCELRGIQSHRLHQRARPLRDLLSPFAL